MKWITMKGCLTLIELCISMHPYFLGGSLASPLRILVTAQPNTMKFGTVTVLDNFCLKLDRRFNFMQ